MRLLQGQWLRSLWGLELRTIDRAATAAWSGLGAASSLALVGGFIAVTISGGRE